MGRKIEARVEYEIPTIRHMSIRCPNCHKWFIAGDIANHYIGDRFDATSATYTCPLCKESFGKGYIEDEYVFEECSTGLIYDGVIQKKVTWE